MFSSTLYFGERRSIAVNGGSAVLRRYLAFLVETRPNSAAPENDMDPLTGALSARHFDGCNYAFARWSRRIQETFSNIQCINRVGYERPEPVNPG